MHNGGGALLNKSLLALIGCALATVPIIWAVHAFLWPQELVLTISTTTSLYATGFLERLASAYWERAGVRLRFIAVGTGQALFIASRGEADGVIVHAPPLEALFLKGGHGVCRKIIAYNFLIIIGPRGDPAGVRGAASPVEAMKRIADAGRAGKAMWVSRGDRSGTHIRELQLWNSTAEEFGEAYDIYGRRGEWERQWYREAGGGMGATLVAANELGAYTLADAATYAKYLQEGLIDLAPLFSRRCKELLNVYSVIATNPEKHPGVKFNAFLELITFLVSEEGQALFSGHEVGGEAVFYPAVGVLREGRQPEAGWIEDVAFIDGEECPAQYRLGHHQLYEDRQRQPTGSPPVAGRSGRREEG